MVTLAINGGRPIREKEFPSWPIFDEGEEKAILEVLRSGKWCSLEQPQGKVAEFEEKFASFQDAKYGVCCTNGTAGLIVSLLALGIGAGDEVIVPPYTYVATASCVLTVNAIPIFADIDLETANIDPEDVKRKITAKTKAIIPVHFGGLPCDMDALKHIAQKYHLKIVEDACHSWGSQWKGRGAGAIGDCGAFSFQLSKNITAGEGGIILTNSKDIADLSRSYINFGRIEGKHRYEHYLLGQNYRMTEIQAAILLTQLTRLKQQAEKRDENGRYLDEKLKNIPGIRVMTRDGRVTRHAYHLYIFRYVQEKFGNLPREKFIEALKAEGIPVWCGYPEPLYKNPLFLKKGKGPKYCPVSCPFYGEKINYSKVKCPNSEKICQQAIWLSHPVLLAGRKDMDDIVRAIEKIFENREELL